MEIKVEIDFVVIAEAATVSNFNGTFSLLGGGVFNVNSPKFPAIVEFTVLIHAYGDKNDLPNHRYELWIEDEKGEIVTVKKGGKELPVHIRQNIQVVVPRKQPEDLPIPVNILNRMTVEFSRPGDYKLGCKLDTNEKMKPLFVREIPMGSK